MVWSNKKFNKMKCRSNDEVASNYAWWGVFKRYYTRPETKLSTILDLFIYMYLITSYLFSRIRNIATITTTPSTIASADGSTACLLPPVLYSASQWSCWSLWWLQAAASADARSRSDFQLTQLRRSMTCLSLLILRWRQNHFLPRNRWTSSL